MLIPRPSTDRPWIAGLARLLTLMALAAAACGFPPPPARNDGGGNPDVLPGPDGQPADAPVADVAHGDGGDGGDGPIGLDGNVVPTLLPPSDDFSDPTATNRNFDDDSSNGAMATETNGELVINLVTDQDDAHGYLTSKTPFALRGNAVSVCWHESDTGRSDDNAECFMTLLADPTLVDQVPGGSPSTSISWFQGQLAACVASMRAPFGGCAIDTLFGSEAIMMTPYDPVAQKCWRIREKDGTLTYEYSADDSGWMQLWSTQVSSSAQLMQVDLGAVYLRLGCEAWNPSPQGSPPPDRIGYFDDLRVYAVP
jgi:hypothetical protein